MKPPKPSEPPREIAAVVLKVLAAQCVTSQEGPAIMLYTEAGPYAFQVDQTAIDSLRTQADRAEAVLRGLSGARQ
jgi:hypothetical protein